MNSDEDCKKIGFLLITLKRGKGFWLGNSYVSFNKVKGLNQVSIGVYAPTDVKIDRETPCYFEKKGNIKNG